MALISGTRLGPYEIATQIGKGGMGEVYRALDPNLGRQVAIKVLPDTFARDPERLARFEREAKTLAALNHSNIAQIYGLEKADGVRALVMELVEGSTLAERIAQGPIPVNETLAIARQIAEALEAAHELGIVHRDLKPANIKVRPDGTVKVLDFGLAKAMDTAGSAASAPGAPGHPSALSMSPTITSPALLTGAGIILGTASYMSPEQARGKAVDKRSDVWAFGCVLYEMLTGRRAFGGDDVTDVLARVLERDVEFGAIPASVPPAVHRLLRRCLAKDPRQRLSGIEVARLEIDDALTARPEIAQTASAGSRSRWERAAWAAGVVGAAVVAGGAAYYTRPSPAPPPEVHFEIPVTQMRFLSDIAISPDGRRVAFAAATPSGRDGIWVRELDAPTVRLLAGTENTVPQPMSPAWSPDSRYLVFAADGNLKKVDVTGAPPQTLTALGGQIGGATWNRNNVIIFASNDHGLRRVSASGGEVSEVSERDASLEEIFHDNPVFLPDGRHFLYLAWSNAKPENRAIFIGSLDSKSRTRLMTAESNATYSQGRLLFLRGDTLVAQPFDSDRLQFTGDALALGVRVAKVAQQVGAFSVSDTATLIYREPGTGAPTRQFLWMDRGGKTVKAADAEFPMAPGMNWSSDGSVLIFARQGQNGRWNLWGLPLTGNRKPFPYRNGDFSENEASLSPSGRFLAFTSNESGRNEVIVQPFPDPSGGRWQISTEGGSAPRWRRDGRELYYIDLKGRLIGVSVTTVPDFSVQQTTLTLQTPIQLPVGVGGVGFPYDVQPDGQRFLLSVPVAGITATPSACV